MELAELLCSQKFPVGRGWADCCNFPEVLVPSGAADTPIYLPFVLYGFCSGGVCSGLGSGWALGFISLSPPTHLQPGELGPRETERLVRGAEPRSSNAGTRTGLCHPQVSRFCRLFGGPVGMCICSL